MSTNHLRTIEDLRLALRPFDSILKALDDLTPLASAKQAVQETDSALQAKRRELEEVTNEIEAVKVKSVEDLEANQQEAVRVLSAAKDEAKQIVEKAKYKQISVDNEIERKVQSLEETALELVARVDSLKKEEASLIKSVGELETKEQKVKDAIKKLAQVD